MMEDVSSSGSSKDTISSFKYDEEVTRRAVRKLDLAILPIMAMFYFLSFLDRVNIGNARVAGLQKDLGLSDHQYQICVTILYVPYIATELPANLVLKRIGANWIMPGILTIWGIIVISQGFVTSYSGLMAARFFLGLLEGPMFPGIVLYLSNFYTRRDLSLRVAYFFSSASLSGAFSGLLAAAINNMDGLSGKEGWRWIFILEGLFSVLVGLLSFFLVPAAPRNCKILTEEEKSAVEANLLKDRAQFPVSETFRLKDIFHSAISPHVIFLFLIFFMGGAIFYGLALFLPSITQQLGFSATHSQLLTVGPFGASFIISIFVAYTSDRYNVRGIPTVMLFSLLVVGSAVFLRAENKWIAYGSFYFSVPGAYASAPLISAWMANNSEPYFRRATSIAIAFIGSNAGGILSTWRFPRKEGPKFTKTTVMNLVFSVLMVVLTILNIAVLRWRTAQKRKLRDQILAPYVTEKELDGGVRAWMELGDRHPDFKYTL